MDKQAREAKQMVKELPFRDKVAHIWTYYRGIIITVLVIVLAIGGTAYQIATRPSYDLEISCYTKVGMTEEAIAALESYFAEYVEDLDGDGEKTVKIYDNVAASMGPEQDGVVIMQQKFTVEIAAAQYPVFLLDESFAAVAGKGDLDGTMESFRSIKTAPEIAEILNLPEGQELYWSTRILYENEQDKPESLAKHQMAVAIEKALFGERE
ncbi:MAG: hypothetical protein IJB80_07165 [Clostridia bacterium]|nr:hypothetical protein [Clostridia bacterium]